MNKKYDSSNRKGIEDIYVFLGSKIDSLYFGRNNGHQYTHRGVFTTPHEELISRAFVRSFNMAYSHIQDILAVEGTNGGSIGQIIHFGDDTASQGLIMTPHAALETARHNGIKLDKGGFYSAPPIKVFPDSRRSIDFYLSGKRGSSAESKVAVVSIDAADKFISDLERMANYNIRVSKK